MSKPSPDKIYGKILAAMFLALCKDIHAETGVDDVRVSADFNYRDAKGVLSMKSFVSADGGKERLLGWKSIKLHKRHGPILTPPLNKFCEQIFIESKASGIRVSCEFIFRNGKGDLALKSFITADGTTERMLDSEVMMPRGAKLQHDAQIAIRKAFLAVGGSA